MTNHWHLSLGTIQLDSAEDPRGDVQLWPARRLDDGAERVRPDGGGDGAGAAEGEPAGVGRDGRRGPPGHSRKRRRGETRNECICRQRLVTGLTGYLHKGPFTNDVSREGTVYLKLE